MIILGWRRPGNVVLCRYFFRNPVLLGRDFFIGGIMEIIKVENNKKKYLDLLLLGDEQESMIDRYLERGTMYIMKENEVVAVCVVTDEGNSVLEIKNISVYPQYQNMGYGRKFIEFIEKKYHGFKKIKVGTGDSPLTVPFYQKCGFKEAYRIKNFFIENYDHPIYECGVQLKDMIYFEK